MSHHFGCQQRESLYGVCSCASIELRENTEELRRFNEQSLPAREEGEQVRAELAELKRVLREYLALSSADGRAERQPLRAKLAALST